MNRRFGVVPRRGKRQNGIGAVIPRPSTLQLRPYQDELVAERLVRDLVVLLRGDFALQAADAPVLGHEVHDLGSLVALLLHPRGEGRAGRDERWNVVSG